MKSLTTISILSLIAISTSAISQNDTPDFDNLDANRDGQISRDEAQADERVASAFEAADQDRSGTLSAKEFAVLWY